MTTEASDHCSSSGGSASQSPDLHRQIHDNTNNNTNNTNAVSGDCNNNAITTTKSLSTPPGKEKIDDALSSTKYLDDIYYGNLHQEVQKKDRKIKQRNRRQVFQQQCDAIVRLVPSLRNRTGRTPLTKKEIIKSTAEYINTLKEDTLSTSHHFREELRLEKERNAKLRQELQLWKVKVQLLREERQSHRQQDITKTSTPPTPRTPPTPSTPNNDSASQHQFTGS